MAFLFDLFASASDSQRTLTLSFVSSLLMHTWSFLYYSLISICHRIQSTSRFSSFNSFPSVYAPGHQWPSFCLLRIVSITIHQELVWASPTLLFGSWQLALFSMVVRCCIPGYSSSSAFPKSRRSKFIYSGARKVCLTFWFMIYTLTFALLLLDICLSRTYHCNLLWYHVSLIYHYHIHVYVFSCVFHSPIFSTIRRVRFWFLYHLSPLFRSLPLVIIISLARLFSLVKPYDQYAIVSYNLAYYTYLTLNLWTVFLPLFPLPPSPPPSFSFSHPFSLSFSLRLTSISYCIN